MADIQREIHIELDNIQTTLDNLDKAIKRRDRDVVELAAIGAFLHNFYSGVERILKKLVGGQGQQQFSILAQGPSAKSAG